MYPAAKAPKYVHLALGRSYRGAFTWKTSCNRHVGIVGTTCEPAEVTCPKCLVAMVIAVSRSVEAI